jgi:hypothetical protein
MSKKSTKSEKTPKAPKKAKYPDEPKKMTALDAAHRVLEESGQVMTAPEIYESMKAKGYWESPNGLTPAATIYAAMLREIGIRGKDARFRRPEPSKFAAAKV